MLSTTLRPLGVRMEQKYRSKWLPWPGFKPRTIGSPARKHHSAPHVVIGLSCSGGGSLFHKKPETYASHDYSVGLFLTFYLTWFWVYPHTNTLKLTPDATRYLRNISVIMQASKLLINVKLSSIRNWRHTWLKAALRSTPGRSAHRHHKPYMLVN